MKVLLVDGPKAGAILDVEAAGSQFVVDGERYTVVYDVLYRHPTRPGFKMAAPFAVSSEGLQDALSGDLEFTTLQMEILRSMQQYRWLPDLRVYERDVSGKGPACG